MPRPTTARIHTDALRHNLRLMRSKAPQSRVMAVVKANAYGHGLELVVRALANADAFAVAAMSEAERIRAEGLNQPILLLPGLDSPQDIPRMQQLRIDSVIHSHTQIEMLEQAATSLSQAPLRCWLKVDTGMHRLGFAPEHVRDAHARLAVLPGGSEIVLMSHFASSDDLDGTTTTGQQTQRQLTIFDQATAGLSGPRSLANSAAILGWPQSHGDWIRPGGALYGISVASGRTGADFGLRPAMTMTSRLLAVNHVPRGEHVGYSAAWQTPEDMAIGVAPMGYGDGYPRQVPAGTPVLVNGRMARVVGRVSMDMMTIDLRDHPDAKAGDPVVLWGEGLPVEVIAEAAGTIGYVPVCSVTRRVHLLED